MEDRYIHWHAGNTLLHDSFARVASSHWVTSDDETFFTGLSRSLLVKGNAFLGCGSHLSPPQQPRVILEYGPFQRAHGWLLELAGLILFCTFLCWNLLCLLAQQKNASLRELGNLKDLEGIRIKTRRLSSSFNKTSRFSHNLPTVSLLNILSQRGLRISVASTSGLEVLSTPPILEDYLSPRYHQFRQAP